jgi:outer membrane biosynthesis protein TonB
VRKSAFISIALHVAILLWVLVAFPVGRALDLPKIEDVPVDILTPSEFTKLKAGMADTKNDAPLAAKPQEPKPAAIAEKEPAKASEPVAAVPSPPAAAEKVEEAPKADPKSEKSDTPAEAKPETVERKPKEPEPKKEEPKAVDAKPAKPVKDEKPKPKAAPTTEKKHDFNSDRIAALLNKIPSAAKEPVAQDAPADTPRKPVHGQSNGTQMTMSVNEIDALRSRIAQCWSPPPGGLGAGQIVVQLRLKLNEDGTLVGYPSVANSGSSPFFQAAADSAVRAVYQCQPYSLPNDKYALWRDMILNFDPSEMYRAG